MVSFNAASGRYLHMKLFRMRIVCQPRADEFAFGHTNGM